MSLNLSTLYGYKNDPEYLRFIGPTKSREPKSQNVLDSEIINWRFIHKVPIENPSIYLNTILKNHFLEKKEKKEPELFQYFYNHNGIKATITGTKDDVLATLESLKQVPPQKPGPDGKTKYSHIIHTDHKTIPVHYSADKLLITTYGSKGEHAIVEKNNKKYSGSGILLIIKNKNPDSNFVVLFKSSLDYMYADLGGKLDSKITVSNDNLDDILFKNAVKEATEEGVMLFDVANSSSQYIDIMSNNDGTYYRCYTYVLEDVNKKDLILSYQKNMSSLMKKSDIPHDYFETDSVAFFKLNDIIRTLKDYEDTFIGTNNLVVASDTGLRCKINSRVLHVINNINKSNKLDSILSQSFKNIYEKQSMDKIKIE
jgi:hypothetical protein